MPLPASFHPLIRAWFKDTYGEPTAVQAETWPLIERGDHVLALAPTGSGKTLTAFLSAISRFCPNEEGVSEYQADKLTVLYVSPLKALNEDINRNLLKPLEEIRLGFEKAALPFPPVRVETRSGDTPQAQRRRFLIHPPSILALTPESLAILLSSQRGRQTLSTVKYLILDEIHAVLGNKRGAFLSCQIERLSHITGEFQRIGLSATIRSPRVACEFVGGLGRPVSVASPPSEKKIELKVEFDESVPFVSRAEILANEPTGEEHRQIGDYGRRYAALIDYVLKKISARSTILVFTNSRRRCERLVYFINRENSQRNSHNGAPVAFAHHGSLSKELRRTVEQRLAAGTLPCVVATSSLELGIDIGSVDEVILAGCPGSVTQAMQRIGRAGHGVGKISRASLFPFHGLDLLSACAMEDAVKERDIEEIHPIENPLDLLAQIILCLCVEKNRNIEELFTLLKTFFVFRNLDRDSYIRTVRMLAGLGEKTRMREIKPRIWLDSGEIGALRGSLQLLYSSGGVITSRGLYSLRLKDGTKIGELDEEFVWERRLGDCFDFGGRGWRIASIGPESVEAVPLDGSANSIPFWKADSVFRSSNLSKRILSTLDSFDAADDSAGRIENQALRAFLKSQAAAQGGCALPGSGNIAVEIINSSEINKGFIQVLLHSFRGGALNYPLSLALAQDLEENLSLRVECFSNDDSILLLIPQLISADTGGAGYDRAGSGFSTNCETHKPIEEIVGRSLMNMGALRYGEKLLTKRLETTGLFGATFREAAERSLLIPRALFGKRSPLWITRQRSKRLFDAVAGEGSFPITQEAWRCCLNDSFDMEGFRNLTDDIQSGTVTLSFFHTNKPSPFAQDLVRQETNEFIYDYDERKDLRGAAGPSLNETLSDRVIREALGDPGLRPRLKPELISDFTSRLRREIPGWTAEDELSLSEWVKERIAVPLDEWEILLAALPETLREKLCGRPAEVFPDGPLERIKIVKRQGAGLASVVHREWEKTWNDDALSLLGLWLRYEGPVSLDRIVEVFGSSRAGAEDAAAALVEINEAVNDIEPWSADSPTVSADDSPTPTTDASSAGASATGLICDRENLEMLLRLARRKERPQVKERPAALLGPFLALRQGIIAADRATETEMEAVGTSAANLNPDSFWKKISAWPAQAKLWETEFFIARNISYNEDMLDRKIREGELVWFGNGKNRIGFCRPEDLDLVFPPEKNEKTTDGFSGLFSPEKDGAEGFFDRPRDFWEIKEEFTRLKPGSNSNDCVQALWREVWQGRLCADSFEPVRRGIEDGFGDMQKADALLPAMNSTVPFPGGRYPHIPRALRNRWKSGAPVAGRWFSLELENEEAADPLSEELLNRGRVRLLLGRWGILCRPLLEHESPSFSWSKLLPAMRRMELAGELTAGRFFAGINSLQFASPAVLRDLEKAEALREIYWMNAADPASPAGLDIEGLSTNLPERSPHNRLYFRGAELIAVSCRGGKELRIFIGNDDPDISRLITLFKLPRSRNASPEKKILIEKINGEAAAVSHFAALLLKAGFTADRGKLCLW